MAYQKFLLALFSAQDCPNNSSISKLEWHKIIRCSFAGKPAANSCEDDLRPNTKSSMKVGCKTQFRAK